jgi:hypothetical protein
MLAFILRGSKHTSHYAISYVNIFERNMKIQALSVVITTLFLLSISDLSQAGNLSKRLTSSPGSSKVKKPMLRFNKEGAFKIIQFTDIHNGKLMDPRTTSGMEKILDSEKPDFVILTGDTVTTGSLGTLEELRVSVADACQPMVARKIPWVVVFGNHDTDNIVKIGVTKEQMLDLYRALPYNINPPTAPDTFGAGNSQLSIMGSKTSKPSFGIWLLDSNAYAPATVSGQKLGGYDWIHTNQILWYFKTSTEIEKKQGGKLLSLMFFHICLPEFSKMVSGRPFTGEKNEPECPADLNGGLFTALLDRGDVLGVYVGHDHTNTYEGDYYGIRLGYGGGMGYATYGLDSKDPLVANSIRGARVFNLKETDPRAYESHYIKVDLIK